MQRLKQATALGILISIFIVPALFNTTLVQDNEALKYKAEILQNILDSFNGSLVITSTNWQQKALKSPS